MDKENNKIIPFKTIDKIADKLRDVLNSSDNVLLYAYNGTGKTRLSMAFKNKGKKKMVVTLYISMLLQKTCLLGTMT